MEKIRLDILGLSSSQSEIGHFALILEESDGNRRLPIIIDGFQARSIALEIENIKPNRPMTHDLIVSIAQAIGLSLKEVLITELKDGIFYAKLIFEMNGETYEIDSRTSDAVAIGVRFKVPIFTYEAVLKVAGIEVSDAAGEEDEALLGDIGDVDEDFDEEEMEEEEEMSLGDRIQSLQTRIEDAISREDYELAANLRDEISRLQAGDSDN